MFRMTFRSSWFGFWFSGVGIVSVLLVVSYAQYGFAWDNYTRWGLSAIGAYLLGLIWIRYQTYVEITPDGVLINAGAHNFAKPKVDIGTIKYVARVQQFVFRGWGSMMVMYGLNASGELAQTFLRESAYDAETLRSLLMELKRRNPRVELDPEYVSFLSSPTDDTWLSDHPAERTPSEVETILRERFVRN
jgi:hypothetical protein